MDRYDPKTIEPRWQKVWEDEHTWEVSNDFSGKRKSYVLEMLPYTSGRAAHRAPEELRRRGTRWPTSTGGGGEYVLHPMGYDAFGLPAENHAIKTGSSRAS